MTAAVVGIAIVNFRTGPLVVDCLSSVEREKADLPVQVVVADNASHDGSAELIAGAIENNHWDSWASLIRLPTNGGFSYGNNACFRRLFGGSVRPRYCLLLNPDTLVRAGAIQSLVRFLDAHPEVGIAGSRLEDPDGTPQISAFRFHTILGEFDNQLRLGLVTRLLRRWAGNLPISETPTQVDWVAGASMMVRPAVFDDIGFLDECYFLYFEEVDFCLRARRSGWPCWYVPESRVVHLVGQATGVTNPSARLNRLPAYWFDSRRRYFLKNHGPAYATVVDCVWFAGHVLWRLRSFLQRKPKSTPERLLSDYVRNSVFSKGYRL